jgi:proteasome alpha subunit
LEQAIGIALRAWALGDRLQRQAVDEPSEGRAAGEPAAADGVSLYAYLRTRVEEKTIECALLDRHVSGSSKYRALTSDELGRLLPKDLKPSLS